MADEDTRYARGMPRTPRAVPRDLSVPVQHLEEEVPREFEGQRLDAYLRKRYPWRSREGYQGMIRSGLVRVNGAARKASTPVRWRDVIWVDYGEPEDLAQDPRAIPLRILIEDDELLVLDKQPGVLVHPVGKARFNTLTNALHARYRNLADPSRDVVPRLVHRLDKGTSGVLLVAKTDRARVELGRQFEDREVRKEYLALVRGEPRGDSGTVDLPVVPEPRSVPGRPRMTTVPVGEGPEARTDWSVEERFRGYALLRFRLHTGRTHQIRVHSLALGLPLVGDDQYGDGKPFTASVAAGADAPARGEEPLVARTALHSARLVFTHPRSGEPVDARAPLPDDLQKAVRALKNSR
jgi:23S rRNA pseudouridine1911/1915/1917 synthase